MQDFIHTTSFSVIKGAYLLSAEKKNLNDFSREMVRKAEYLSPPSFLSSTDFANGW